VSIQMAAVISMSLFALACFAIAHALDRKKRNRRISRWPRFDTRDWQAQWRRIQRNG